MQDLNQDGAPDLVATNYSANSVSVLYGNGDGTFDPKIDFPTGNGPYFVALGDLNGDGYGDMVTTDMDDNTVSVFLGTAFLGASYTGKADGVWYFHVRAVNVVRRRRADGDARGAHRRDGAGDERQLRAGAGRRRRQRLAPDRPDGEPQRRPT